MPKPRQRTQLTVQIPDPGLLTRLKALADQRRQTLTTVVVEALEALLDGPQPGPGGGDLLQRVEALERDVQALKRRPAAAAVTAPPVTAAAPLAPPPAPLELDLPDGAITTAELARRTGTNHKGWNNWAASRAAGEVRVHPDAGSWRLVGRVPSEAGGPARCMWEPVTAGQGQAGGQALPGMPRPGLG